MTGNVLKYGPRNFTFPRILKRMICQLNLIIFNFKAWGLILIKLKSGALDRKHAAATWVPSEHLLVHRVRPRGDQVKVFFYSMPPVFLRYSGMARVSIW